MARAPHAVVALLATLAAAPAGADCFDWSNPGAVIEQGTLRGLPTGPLQWRIGRTAATGAHMATAVEVRWTGPDGRGWSQTLFEQMPEGYGDTCGVGQNGFARNWGCRVNILNFRRD